MEPENTAQTDEFLFVGNDLALDFVNTRPLIGPDQVELLPDFSSLLRWLKAAGLLADGEAKELDSQWTASVRATLTLQTMHKLREKLRSQLLVWEKGRSISSAFMAELNALMRRYPMLTRMKTNRVKTSGVKTVRDRPAVELWFEKNEPEQLFAPIAHHAAMLFARADPSRVRKCHNCILHFLDTSKKGTRRWCSMQLCGNRLKVAAYAARQRR